MRNMLRFPDLKARKIAKGWPQLRDLIETHGFPPGFYLTPQQRCWWEDEVETWLEARLPLLIPASSHRCAAVPHEGRRIADAAPPKQSRDRGGPEKDLPKKGEARGREGSVMKSQTDFVWRDLALSSVAARRRSSPSSRMRPIRTFSAFDTRTAGQARRLTRARDAAYSHARHLLARETAVGAPSRTQVY